MVLVLVVFVLLVLVLLVMLLGVHVVNVLLPSLVLLDVLGILGQLGVLVFLLSLVGGGAHCCSVVNCRSGRIGGRSSSLYVSETLVCRHHLIMLMEVCGWRWIGRAAWKCKTAH